MTPDQAQYTPHELKQLRITLMAGTVPDCPRCEIRMSERPIGGGSFGLGYARKREWLICRRCHRSAIFDLKRGTRN